MIAYFLCLETLTALLLLSRQAGGYQDVVKEVGLEPAIKLAKSTASVKVRSGGAHFEPAYVLYGIKSSVVRRFDSVQDL